MKPIKTVGELITQLQVRDENDPVYVLFGNDCQGYDGEYPIIVDGKHGIVLVDAHLGSIEYAVSVLDGGDTTITQFGYTWPDWDSFEAVALKIFEGIDSDE